MPVLTILAALNHNEIKKKPGQNKTKMSIYGTNKLNSLLGCLVLDCTEQFSSVVTTWKNFLQYVQDSVSNMAHLPAVNQRIQSRIEKNQR